MPTDTDQVSALLTQEQVKEIAEREAKATPGPWGACGDPARPPIATTSLSDPVLLPHLTRKGMCSCGQVWSIPTDSPVLSCEGGAWGDTYPAIRVKENGCLEAYQEMIEYGSIPRESQQANMAFVARARTDIPALLSHIGALEAKLEGHGSCVTHDQLKLAIEKHVADRTAALEGQLKAEQARVRELEEEVAILDCATS